MDKTTEENTLVLNPDELHDEDHGTTNDDTGNSTTIQVDKPITEPPTIDEVGIPIEKVGCIFVTNHLHKYLDEYPQLSDNQAFLDIFHMLSLLDRYLYDNPRQHVYCMSSNNEYVTLLNHTIYLHVDISMFPMIWAVLSILLDTQDHKLKYVKFLKEEYNRYYENITRENMEKLEAKAIAIQACMHDRVSYDFGSISDYSNNGLTPLQGQQDEQSEAVNAAEKAIDYDASDIMTEYPPWSTETYDFYNSDENIYD